MSAASSGADLVLVDLEDAVAPAEKEAARHAVVEWLNAGGIAAVRINARGTSWFEADLAALVATQSPVVVPKVESTEDVDAVRNRLLPGTPIVGLVETAVGLANLMQIGQSDGLTRMAFGNVDLAADLRIDPDDSLALLHARSSLVIASSANQLPAPVDGVTTAIDEELANADAQYARRLGFGGKLCIHPRQISGVHAAFRPSEAEVSAARRVLSRYHGGVIVIDGHMVDEPVAARARLIVDRVD